jgi:hypothetical protein
MIFVVIRYQRTVAGLIAFAQRVVEKMTDNPYFPTATQTLASTTSAIAAYQDAISASATTKGLKGRRTSSKRALLKLLNRLRDIVRVAAEADSANALMIVESAGMTLKKYALPFKALISVAQAKVAGRVVSGSVVCNAKAPGIPTSYFWFYSLDQEDWTAVPMAMKSKLTISGLTRGKTYYFRYYTVTRKGTSGPTQVFSFMVE